MPRHDTTPRKQFPSDHRRWFRVMEDILDNPKIARVDLEALGLYVKLLAVLNRQKSKDGKGTMDLYSATALAQRERWAYAKRVWSRLSSGDLVRFCYSDATVSYEVPNWPKRQGFTPSEFRQDSVETPTTTPTPKTTPTPNKKRVRVSSESAFPEPFPVEARSSLLGWAGTKGFGESELDHAIEVVRDWAAGNGKRKKDWQATIRNAMTQGWALQGFNGGKDPYQRAVEESRAYDRARGIVE